MVTILALCTFADGPLSMYQVSISLLVFFQRYSPDSLFIAKIKKRSNSVNTFDIVMVLALCCYTNGPLSMYYVSFNSLVYFYRYATDKFLLLN